MLMLLKGMLSVPSNHRLVIAQQHVPTVVGKHTACKQSSTLCHAYAEITHVVIDTVGHKKQGMLLPYIYLDTLKAEFNCTSTLVLLKGMLSMPSGRRLGILGSE
jgi:hypothetical protein